MRTLAAALLLAATASAHADIRITNDSGGNVAAYQSRVASARASGERVVIDGFCGSACTLWLTLPASQICATPRAVFAFHTATTELGTPHPQTNDAILRTFPPHVRNYILRRGGLWLNVIRVRGTALARACR